ncbi:hypothetical protein F4604DRAFT_1276967 [Suillus subluteus]|nr:hypothetical protein F4604DRAFT_1276967 [Suillus subluteus]
MNISIFTCSILQLVLVYSIQNAFCFQVYFQILVFRSSAVLMITFLILLLASSGEHLSCGQLYHIQYFPSHLDFISNDAHPSLTPLIGCGTAGDGTSEAFNMSGSAVLVQGKPVRIHQVLDPKTFKEILNVLALADFTVIHLLEAEQALTVLKAHQSELLHEYKLIKGHLYITPTISGSALQ